MFIYLAAQGLIYGMQNISLWFTGFLLQLVVSSCGMLAPQESFWLFLVTIAVQQVLYFTHTSSKAGQIYVATGWVPKKPDSKTDISMKNKLFFPEMGIWVAQSSICDLPCNVTDEITDYFFLFFSPLYILQMFYHKHVC